MKGIPQTGQVCRNFEKELGILRLQLFRDCILNEVLLDDYFAFHQSTREPIYVGSRSEEHIWAQTLVKGFAKMSGSYASLAELPFRELLKLAGYLFRVL